MRGKRSRNEANKINRFLISNFRHVLNVACLLLGNSPVYEFSRRGITQKKAYKINRICVWPCIINLGKIIWKNQLEATIIYWSTRSAQYFAHLQERKTEIFTTYGIVSCCCGRQGFGERQHYVYCKKEFLPSYSMDTDSYGYGGYCYGVGVLVMGNSIPWIPWLRFLRAFPQL